MRSSSARPEIAPPSAGAQPNPSVQWPSYPHSNYSSQSKAVNRPPQEPPTDDQLWGLVRHYLFSADQPHSPVVSSSNLVVIFGFSAEKVTAEALASAIKSFPSQNKSSEGTEHPYEKKLRRLWLIRSRMPQEFLDDGSLKSTTFRHSGSTASAQLGGSWRFAFASFDTPSSAYQFYQDLKGTATLNVPNSPPPKVKMADPLKTFVRLDPDDEEEVENLKYSWEGVGKKGWDGIYREGFGNDKTYWAIEDDRVGAEIWIAANFRIETSNSSGDRALKSASVVPRSREWNAEDDDVLEARSSKARSTSFSKEAEGSRKRARLELDAESDGTVSTHSNDKLERTRKVPLLAGSKKVAKEISKWQSKQTELHQDPNPSPPPNPHSQSAPMQSQSPPGPNQSSTGAVEYVPVTYDFSDPVKKACFLCSRQFKSLEVLRRHEVESDLHKNNLADESARRAGLDRKTLALAKRAETDQNEKQSSNGFAPIKSAPALAKVDPSSTTSPKFSIDTSSRYRDRALERRSVFGADNHASSTSSHRRDEKRKVFEGPAPVLTSEEPEPRPEREKTEEIESDNVGAKLLAQMGWEKGKGLGTEFQGRSTPVEAAHHGMGAGLGSGNRKGHSSGSSSSSGRDRDESEEKRVHKGNSHKGKKFDKGYLDATRDSARERFQGK